MVLVLVRFNNSSVFLHRFQLILLLLVLVSPNGDVVNTTVFQIALFVFRVHYCFLNYFVQDFLA